MAKMLRGRRHSRINYHPYIRSRKWYAKHKQWLRATGYACALFPWVKIGRGRPYRIHHLHYANLGNERLGRDVIPLCPFAHDQVIHGILSGCKSAGQQRHYPNLSQRLIHTWCRQRLWFKRVILIGGLAWLVIAML